MTEPTIFVCKPSTLRPKDAKALRAVGVIVIEMDDPSAFKLVRPSTEIDSSSMLMIALKAIKTSNSSYPMERLGRLLIEHYLEAEKETP